MIGTPEREDGLNRPNSNKGAIKMKNQNVIEKCQEVLRQTEDGNRLTAKELSELEFLTNNYYALSNRMAVKALASLQNMIDCRMTPQEVA